MPELSAEKKLIWLGFKNPVADLSAIKKEIEKLKDGIGDFSDFQADLDAYDLDGDGTDDDIDSYADLQTYLEDNGFTTEEATAFIDKIKNNFDSYADFEDYVQNTATSYEEITVEFTTTSGVTSEGSTEDGDSAAGIIFHETAGVSKDGVSVPAGTTEVFGNRVEFSQTGTVQTAEPDIVYSNLAVSNGIPDVGETVTVSADVANNGSVDTNVYPQLTVDGNVRDQKKIFVPAGTTGSVEFDTSFGEVQEVDVSIGGLSPITLTVGPTSLEGV